MTELYRENGGTKMKPAQYIFALLITLSIVFLYLSYPRPADKVNLPFRAEIDSRGNFDAQEAYAEIDELSASLQSKIDALDALLAEYAQENGRLNIENQAYRDYIDGFWEFMSQQHDFEGHQKLYERTHK